MTIYTDSPQLHGGAWISLQDNNKISYQVLPDEGYADFNFFGPIEVSLNMSTDTIRRCHELFGQALDEITKGAP
ncbi:hypothetical protein F0L68_29105 [Solihabitans fulvus]|uniref:Uncharacterized protein n=1 Tax=Solihabitans fulvus TaxID=1892852 RepID=A0A5B2WVB7_9PSEU|nr:hypothetical protein [Solihabitans fulvus]KAA2254844.1 hypothetical protein F0L68_29105 [Solihabitans fulvus]